MSVVWGGAGETWLLCSLSLSLSRSLTDLLPLFPPSSPEMYKLYCFKAKPVVSEEDRISCGVVKQMASGKDKCDGLSPLF